MMTTKEKIIYEALRLFSEKGYDGVSMREIAAAVGIRGASIYNHFKGKEDIFQAIFKEMMKQYEDAAVMMNIPTQENEETIRVYETAGEERLLAMTEQLFGFFTQNEFVVMFRKLLASEQHKWELAANCLKEYYLEAPIQFQSRIFEGLQQKGHFREDDAKLMALHFYSPIYYHLCKFDLGCPYEDCLQQLKEHVRFFCAMHEK